jgi:hypothetical protein
MTNVALAENYVENKKAEYIDFVERLGESVRFSEDKWVCDKLRRAPSEGKHDFTLYFNKIPEKYREVVKYFSALRIVAGTTVGTVSVDICNLKKLFDFWSAKYSDVGLHMCDEFITTMFYQQLEEDGELAETTKCRVSLLKFK